MYRVISLMSGTSLDGVDIAYCEFEFDSKWKFALKSAETISYSNEWRSTLRKATELSGLELSLLNVSFGKYLGELVRKFSEKNSVTSDFISSHGHTVFHQPSKKLTLQIGSGAAIAAAVKRPVICDFRTTDIALGGQGAPLVPVGDALLFSEYKYCLNLGGIANISFQENGISKAFDICACNIVLNQFATEKNSEFDKDGALAANGKVNDDLLKALNNIDYYSLPFPKSLGKEDIDQYIFPLINSFKLKTEDKLATFCRHIAVQISKCILEESGSILITGGGAFNTFLIDEIQSHSKASITIPAADIINFKEAIIFGFLGVLRMEQKDNCLKSVTGALKNNCGGAIYHY